MGFLELSRKLNLLREQLLPILEKVLNDLSDDIEQLNKNQLLDNKLIDGSLLPNYAERTYSFKKEKGTYISPAGRWALLDYGDFYNKFLVKAINGELILDSEDGKTGIIEGMVSQRTGKQNMIFGLTDESKVVLFKLMYEPFRNEVLKFLEQ